MNARLSALIGEEFLFAKEPKRFFAQREKKSIDVFEEREQPPIGVPGASCTTNLFFGFFFDGTRNNYTEAEKDKVHSNVARLYDCYPGLSVPRVLPATTDWPKKPEYDHFFKVYVPGVGTAFDQVRDTGKSFDRTGGAAVATWGGRRLIWALVQAINNVARYFLGTPLVPPEDMPRVIAQIDLDKLSRQFMLGPYPLPMPPPRNIVPLTNSCYDARVRFEYLLRALHDQVSDHWPNPKTGKPWKTEPALVKKIYISIFGFSRGASEARAFINWLQSLCKLDAQIRGKSGMSLGGFDVEFDFLGLFDTVASVGLGNTVGIFRGHNAWADAEDSLRIPPGVKCLHLVSAHEIRRSFPLDSISVNGALPDGCEEIVIPGVHSDIGGGYAPLEQGRGTDPNGADMLSRIPLLMMYKAARLSGVPLKLELASSAAQSRFAVKPEVIDAYNAYIATCSEKQGPIHKIMREQVRKQIEWRHFRTISGKNPLQNTASFLRASTFDKNDLYSAAAEFEEEVAEYLDWVHKTNMTYKPTQQRPGFDNNYILEWEEITTWWGKHSAPPEAVNNLFDNYVHDSRAWFKLQGFDNETDLRAWLDRLVLRSKVAKAGVMLVGPGGSAGFTDMSRSVTPEEMRIADEYEKTKKIPRMLTEGREPWRAALGVLGRAGYLRFRKVFGGSDSILLS